MVLSSNANLWFTTYSCRRFDESNLRPFQTRQRQIDPFLPRTRLPTLQLPSVALTELLHQPHSGIAGLCERQLLSQTHPRPATERHKRPARAQIGIGPAIRVVLFGVRTPDIVAKVHGVHAELDYGAAGYEERGFAVGAAAAWDDGVDEGGAAVERDYGIDTQG